MINFYKYCADSAPETFGLFDFSIAPPLLFYSYIPIIFASLFFGLYVLIKDKYSQRSKLLFITSLIFIALLLNEILQWVAAPVRLVQFGWQLVPIFRVLVILFTIYFTQSFITKKDLPFKTKLILGGVFSVVLLLFPTKYNISTFDLNNCEGIPGVLWYLVHVFEALSLVWILVIGIKHFILADKLAEKKQILLITIGTILFVFIFFGASVWGDIAMVYGIGLIGPIGMVVFLASLSYMIVKYKTFNTKIFASQFLILTLLFFVSALMFIRDISIIHIVILFTFGLISILGSNLIKSVKHEIEQRENIEKLAEALEATNVKLKELDRQKDGVMHLVAHQLKGPVTTINYLTELLLDNTFGELTAEQKENISTIRSASQKMGSQSEMVLDAAKITSGKLPLDPKPLDLNDLFKNVVAEAENHAREKQVQLNVKVPAKLPTVILDRKYTQLAIDNLLSNAIKYTALREKGGHVDFTVELNNNVLVCSVKDEGIGIPKKEQENIFKELYRGSNAGKEGNGLGLHVAMGAIKAQGGKISFESEENKGSTFIIELPLKHS